MTKSTMSWTATGVLLAIALAAAAAYGQLAYGDWTCGFSHCTRIKELP